MILFAGIMKKIIEFIHSIYYIKFWQIYNLIQYEIIILYKT
jgi:hypothetical protein